MPRRAALQPPVYTFRVRIRDGFYAPPGATEIWREIEIAANQTLADLGHVIPLAFGFDDPHLWSFFLSGRRFDEDSEYALDSSDLFGDKPAHTADRVKIRDVPYPGKTGKKEFLFLFDFGDQWEFGVKLRGTSDTLEASARYPRVVASQGEAPPQYPQLEDDEDDYADDEDVEDLLKEGIDDMQTVMDEQRAAMVELGLRPEQIERVLQPVALRRERNQTLLAQYAQAREQDGGPILILDPPPDGR